MSTPKLYDALIIGGGPAGLSMAVSLARQVYSALILDSGAYRNERAEHMHTVPGFDHVNPADFRAKIRADLAARYPCIEFKQATIKEVRKLDSSTGGGSEFEAVDEAGQVYRGKKLGLATGIRDMLEKEPEGYGECWAKGIFHCLFCEGYEQRGAESVGALATGFSSIPDIAVHGIGMAARLAKHVNVYTNGNDALHSDLQARFHSSKISLDNRPIAKFSLVGKGPAVQITFDDGSTRTEGWIVNHPFVEQRAPFATQLGLEMGVGGEIKVQPPWNETSVKGCFAAGDAATIMRNVIQAEQMGGFVGAAMVAQLQEELDTKDEL